MSKKSGVAAVAAASSTKTTNPTVDALKETLKKVEASLLPAVDSFCVGTKNASTADADDVKSLPLPSALGLDFMHVKNTLLLSYLIDLTVHLRDTVDPLPSHPATSSDDAETKEEESDDDENEESKHHQQKQQQRRRLLEMRTVLDKSRGLDKKLRYQIDKLLSSLTDSSAFATGGVGNNNDNDSDDGGGNNDEQQGFASKEDDPLRYRPNPKSMLDSDDDDSDDSDDDDDDEDEEEDDDLAAARATLSISKQAKPNKKNKNEDEGEDDDEDEQEDRSSGGASKKYIAPRLTAVPYTHDVADKRSEQEKRQRRKLRATELAQTLRQQYGDQPDTEDVFGGGSSEIYGKQRSASRALAQKEAERIEFEESTMVRLTMSRKDKKEKKRVERMMEGGSNLAQMANLGNLVRENQAFGKDDNNDGGSDDDQREEALRSYMSGEQNNNKNSDDGDSFGGIRHANGKRRRDPTTENRADGAGRRLKNGKRPNAYNSLQAALYGSGSSNTGSKSAKGKKKIKRYD